MNKFIGYKALQMSRDLDNTDFASSGLVLVGYNFSGSSLNNCAMDGVVFDNCNFTRAKLRQSNLNRAVFRHCNLHGVDFTQSDLTDTTFYDSDLTAINLSQVIMCRTDLGILPPANVRGTHYFGPIQPTGDHLYATRTETGVMFSLDQLYGDKEFIMTKIAPKYLGCIVALNDLMAGGSDE